MAQRFQDKIDVFFGGKSRDPRIQDSTLFDVIQHIDIFKYPKKLTPERAMEDDSSAAPSTDLIQNFAYRDTNYLYGLGETSTKVKIYGKSDPISGSWAAAASGADASGARNTLAFTMYHGVLYGLAAGSRIWAYNIDGTAFTATALNLTSYTNTCRGLVTRDDLYIQPYDNKVAVKDGAGAGVTANWTAALLTLLDDYVITDLCEFGDLVILAARPKTLNQHSKAFIWDKVNADIIDSVDFGLGTLKIIDVIDGELIGISEQYGTTGGLTPSQGTMVFRKWTSGPQANVFMEVPGDFNTTLTIYGNHVKAADGRQIVFGALITIDGTAYKQLWTVGRSQPGDPLAVLPYLLVDNDTAITSIEALFQLGTYHFVAHNADGSINRENDSTAIGRFTGVTPLYISQKINGEKFGTGFARLNKKLTYAGLMFEKLVSGESVSLSYKKDGDTSWTALFTHSTAGDISRETGTDSSGAEIDKGREYQFKVTMAGGARVTGIFYELEILDGDVQESGQKI